MQYPMYPRLDTANGSDNVYVKRNDMNIELVLSWTRVLLGPRNLS